MVTVKSEHEIQLMREAGLILAEVHMRLGEEIKAGMTTKQVDRLCEKLIRSHNCEPSFLGYEGYPASVCVSINDEVVHGIPSDDRIIMEGDIVSLDTGVIWKGWQSDAARTHAIGKVSDEALKLIEVTRQSFFEGIKVAIPGNHINDIGRAIENYVKPYKFGIVEDLVGHGIGREMHEEPEVPNFYTKRKGIKLQKGMTLAVEPMINAGTWEVAWTEDDDWTVYTRDGSLSAHYENTIAITDGEPEVLSLLPEEKKLYNVK